MHIESVLITGANRGIGLEFVKQILKLSSPPSYLFATCRNPTEAKDLQEIASLNSNVKVLQLDVKEEKSFQKLRQQLEQEIGDIGLNLLINNAGIAIWQSLDTLSKESLLENFEVNTVSPLLLTKELLPLLKTAASKSGDRKLSCSRAAVINITSKMGSVADNTSGSYYPYRLSKAALNMGTKSLAVDLKPNGILALVLHPGWVQTEMGGTNALIDTQRSVSGMLNVIQNAGDKEAGAFIAFDGVHIPW